MRNELLDLICGSDLDGNIVTSKGAPSLEEEEMTNELTPSHRIELLKLAERLTKDYIAEDETLGRRLDRFEDAYRDLVEKARGLDTQDNEECDDIEKG